MKTLTYVAICFSVVLFIPQKSAQGGISYVAPHNVTTLSLDQITKFSQVTTVDSFHFLNQNKSRAPEPPTFLLFMGGVIAMIVRFVQKSFRAFKQLMDYLLSVVAIIFAVPLFLLIAALVKLTSEGPVFYRQQRVGRNGKNFMILKFRSMRVDAEKGTGAVWAKINDPRLTPIGSLLRKSHLDELPQLFNVLKGEMSIVGPRPERPEIVKDLKLVISDYEKRLEILPGITGLAQVMNRYDETITDVRRKVKYDLLYIKRMCWLAEMRILALTCVVVVTGKGAK